MHIRYLGMEHFLKIKFLLRGLRTLKKHTHHYGEWKLEKRNYKHLDLDLSGQCIPHSRPLPKTLCLGQVWLLESSLCLFISLFNLDFSSPDVHMLLLMFSCQHFMIVDKFWRNHLKLSLINSRETKRPTLLGDQTLHKGNIWSGKIFLSTFYHEI